MIIPLHNDFLIIRKEPSFLAVSRAGNRFSVCIETPSEEYCQAVGPDDLIVVSAPEGGGIGAAIMLTELVRHYRTPLVALPKNHPGSRRLKYVVSAGPVIRTDCQILRGTHPEQHLICASAALSGIILRGEGGGVSVENLPPDAAVETVAAELLVKPADIRSS